MKKVFFSHWIESILFGMFFLNLSACTHTTLLHTETPDVEVEVNGKFVGKTPLEYDEWLSADEAQEIVLTRGEKSKVLRVSRLPYSMQATALGMLFGASACCVLSGAGCLIATLDVERNGVVVLATGFAGFLSIVLGGAAGFFQGRRGPDEIHVQFGEEKVQTWPVGRANFILGASVLGQGESSVAGQKY